MCCGKRFTRRLRQPSFVYSLVTTGVMVGFFVGALFGSLLSITLIRYLRINPEEFSTRHWTDWTAEVVADTWGLFQGDTRQCYTSPNGIKPFTEHEGEYEDLSRSSVVYEVEEWYPKPTSSFQDIEMFRSAFFGNVLVIDNEIMITEKDEKHYHEMIAHVPLAYIDQAKRVLIIGGGDGGRVAAGGWGISVWSRSGRWR
jgi:hypothetical protein